MSILHTISPIAISSRASRAGRSFNGSSTISDTNVDPGASREANSPRWRISSPPLRTKQLHGLRLYRLNVVLTAAAKALDGTASDGAALSCLDLATRIPTISGSPFPTLRSADPDSPETELHV